MISVAEAHQKLLDLAVPLGVEDVSLIDAVGRTLAHPAIAQRTQPPFSSSAMDGYAVAGDVSAGQHFTVIGESAAGHRFHGTLNAGEAVRIFTGAPVPENATRVVIQEDVTRDGDIITIGDNLGSGSNIRAMGSDFSEGATLSAPRVLSPEDIALMAAMNIPRVSVTRRPDVAIITTGDELVQPGETPGADQIIASNSYGLAAMFKTMGAAPRLLPIARDSLDSLHTVFDMADGADLIVTIGGASVGDHDLVGHVMEERGMQRSFYKIAMRPGKPLMAGKVGSSVMIGLPGNPVSAMVCGHVFVQPVIRKLLGQTNVFPEIREEALACDLPPNGPRQHYLRARMTADGVLSFDKQDSSLLSILSEADRLIVQPPHDQGRQKGDTIESMDLWRTY